MIQQCLSDLRIFEKYYFPKKNAEDYRNIS